MTTLFISFTIAIVGSIALVFASRALNVDDLIYKILPVVPILYALIYEVLDRRKKARGRSVPATSDRAAVREAGIREVLGLSTERVVIDVGVSFAFKFLIEIVLVALFLNLSGLPFSEAYGSLSMETVGKFLRGEHPWLAGSAGVTMLGLIALLTCLMTGLWIGYTSRGMAVLEGVLTGAAVTFVMSMTNMLVLYRTIEDITVKLADSMGYVMHAGFVVVILVQVLLYGLWSGMVQIGRDKRLK